MTITPGTYLKLRRVAGGLTVVDVAAALATEPHLAEQSRAEWIEQIEADIAPASFMTIAALRSVYSFDLAVLAQLALVHLGAELPASAPAICRVCACTWDDPCEDFGGGCHWHDADQTICSVCVTAPRERAVA